MFMSLIFVCISKTVVYLSPTISTIFVCFCICRLIWLINCLSCLPACADLSLCCAYVDSLGYLCLSTPFCLVVSSFHASKDDHAVRHRYQGGRIRAVKDISSLFEVLLVTSSC